MNITILHNPRCSKSRATLELLRDRGLEPEIRLYLEHPPSADELRSILDRLDAAPRDLIRKSEAEYKALDIANRDLSDDELIDIMVSHPRLIQRPIVLANGKAAVGRPPDSVLAIV